jgi:hypothetical protein
MLTVPEKIEHEDSSDLIPFPFQTETDFDRRSASQQIAAPLPPALQLHRPVSV